MEGQYFEYQVYDFTLINKYVRFEGDTCISDFDCHQILTTYSLCWGSLSCMEVDGGLKSLGAPSEPYVGDTYYVYADLDQCIASLY